MTRLLDPADEQAAPDRDLLPRASLIDTVRVIVRVVLPLFGRGLIVRRPPIVRLAEARDLDRRAVRQLQDLRQRYGAGPVRLRLPFRRLALVLDPDHVHRILLRSPLDFSAANLEKRAALNHFQPAGVLVSEGAARNDRRRFNEAVLDTPAPIHGQAASLLVKVRQEAAGIAAAADRTGLLTWDVFIDGWYRTVRRVVLGDAARDDHEVTDLLGKLRAHANWAFLSPKDRGTRRRFLSRIDAYLARAEPGSLAEVIADIPTTGMTRPEQQVPQWLFAFDPAGMAAYRALALIAAHHAFAARVEAEIAGDDQARARPLPLLRASVLESLRLWPTTPGILRDARRATTWDDGALPARTGLIIFTPFFHRDDHRLAEADRFSPELWAEARTPRDHPLVPFSEGPVVCPGQNLVLFTTTSLLAALLEDHDVALDPADRLGDVQRLPSVLSPFDIRFRFHLRHGL